MLYVVTMSSLLEQPLYDYLTVILDISTCAYYGQKGDFLLALRYQYLCISRTERRLSSGFKITILQESWATIARRTTTELLQDMRFEDTVVEEALADKVTLFMRVPSSAWLGRLSQSLIVQLPRLKNLKLQRLSCSWVSARLQPLVLLRKRMSVLRKPCNFYFAAATL